MNRTETASAYTAFTAHGLEPGPVFPPEVTVAVSWIGWHVSSSSSTVYTVHSMQESGIHPGLDIWNMDMYESDPVPVYVPCKYRSIY